MKPKSSLRRQLMKKSKSKIPSKTRSCPEVNTDVEYYHLIWMDTNGIQKASARLVESVDDMKVISLKTENIPDKKCFESIFDSVYYYDKYTLVKIRDEMWKFCFPINQSPLLV